MESAKKYLVESMLERVDESQFLLSYVDGKKHYITDIMTDFANQSKWISVETEKPEDREYVDCYLSKEINGKNFAYSTYSKKYGFENVPSRIVTHFRRPEKP